MSPTAPNRRRNGLLPLFVIFVSLNAILMISAIASIVLDIETFAIIRMFEEGSDAPELAQVIFGTVNISFLEHIPNFRVLQLFT